MKRLVLLVVLVACDRRTVTITSSDPAVTISVDTDNVRAAEVKVTMDGKRSIVPLLLIPVPTPYRSGPTLAEKP